ncbi:MAG: electron transfer flavoprotein subunit alpha/FixB family protein [Methanobacteriota archaeon]
MGVYRDMWVFCETVGGEFVRVSLEMLGEARRLMDKYNRDYNEKELVVAVILGEDGDRLATAAIAHGADVVYTADHPELAHFRLEPYTRAVSAMATSTGNGKSYDKPRYFLFPATNNGRDLSATVLAELASGLASDCNHLAIEDIEMTNRIKTGGQPRKYPRILHMKRPDFSGFEWSTILCLDDMEKEWSPQACSIIPGSFAPLPEDPRRTGRVVPFAYEPGPSDLRVKIGKREKIVKEADLTGYDVVVAAGRGIADDPTKGLKLAKRLADVLGGDLGISRGIVTAKYPVEAGVDQFTREARQIGETGQMVKPKLYVAVGISGAIQHKKGMDKSAKIVAINTDDSAPIREFSDVFVKGDLFELLPRLIEALERRKGPGGGR